VCLLFNNGNGEFSRTCYASAANAVAMADSNLNRNGKLIWSSETSWSTLPRRMSTFCFKSDKLFELLGTSCSRVSFAIHVRSVNWIIGAFHVLLCPPWPCMSLNLGFSSGFESHSASDPLPSGPGVAPRLDHCVGRKRFSSVNGSHNSSIETEFSVHRS
jgi:hypothetical protein